MDFKYLLSVAVNLNIPEILFRILILHFPDKIQTNRSVIKVVVHDDKINLDEVDHMGWLGLHHTVIL